MISSSVMLSCTWRKLTIIWKSGVMYETALVMFKVQHATAPVYHRCHTKTHSCVQNLQSSSLCSLNFN